MNDDKNEDKTIIFNEKTVIINDKTVLLKTSKANPEKTQNTIDDETKARVTKENLTFKTEAVTASNSNKTIDIGSVINSRFVLEKLLGSGGMGVVYRALDRRKQEANDTDPYIAIKILGEEFKNYPQAFVALQREARKSQSLAHPNIITVYDFDREGDLFYMTMEELDGEPLSSYIKSHPYGVPIAKADKIIRGIAQGLAYAHSKKIIHSDLKPDNIIVSSTGVSKILDFGIARAVTDLSDTETEQDSFDAADLGGLTPTYASAEMFAGEDPHPCDDIYALGLISYELLSGYHPYKRIPAEQLLKKPVSVKKLKGISRAQWLTIHASIEVLKAQRIKSADVFLKKFSGISLTIKVFSLALAISVLALTYSLFLKAPNMGPEIAFEALPKVLQSQITQALSEGTVALKFNDINAALHYFNQAHDLHPKNPDALKGLDAIVTKILTKIKSQQEDEATKGNLALINTLLEYPTLANNEAILAVKKQLEK